MATLTKHQSLSSSSGLCWPIEQNNAFCHHDSRTTARGCQSWAVFPLLPSSLTCATSVNHHQVKAWIHTLLHKLVGNGVLGEGRARSLTCFSCSILKPVLCLLVISVCSSTWARVQRPWTLHKYLVVSCDSKCTPIILPSTLQIKWLYLFNKQFHQLIQ